MSSAFVQTAFPVVRAGGTAARDEQAAVRGRAEGYAAGLRQAAAETAALRAELIAERDAAIAQATARSAAASAILVASAQALDARQAALRTEAQETLLVTSLQLAAAILGYEVETNPSSTVIAALTRALSDVDPAEVVAVRLNPVDLTLLDGQADALGVAFVADPAIARGDARADLTAGFVDAALGSALARAEQALTGGNRS